MPNTSVACRRAAQLHSRIPPSHIWISDEAVAAAANRFFGIICPHQKRHGSHVPGPLEARRRASKRRMTLQAAGPPPDALPLPLFGLGGMFGGRHRKEPAWTYQPPSSKGDKTELSIDQLLFPTRPAAQHPVSAESVAHTDDATAKLSGRPAAMQHNVTKSFSQHSQQVEDPVTEGAIVDVSYSSESDRLAVGKAASAILSVDPTKTRRQIMEMLLTHLCSSDLFSTAPALEIHASLDRYKIRLSCLRKQKQKQGLNEMIVQLLAHLAKDLLPTQKVAEYVVSMLHQCKGNAATADLLIRIRECGLKLSDSGFLTHLAQRASESAADITRSPTFATSRAIRERHAYELRHCEKLHEAIAAFGNDTDAFQTLSNLHVTRRFRIVLERAAADHQLPLVYRSLSKDMSTEEQAAIVHELAQRYAKDPSTRTRPKCRALRLLYDHLRRMGAKIEPRFGEALAQVYIIQPLLDERYVSTWRLSWVCRLVAEAQGGLAAAKLERVFWDLRGRLIQRTNMKAAAGGQEGSGRVGSMRRLGIRERPQEGL